MNTPPPNNTVPSPMPVANLDQLLVQALSPQEGARVLATALGDLLDNQPSAVRRFFATSLSVHDRIVLAICKGANATAQDENMSVARVIDARVARIIDCLKTLPHNTVDIERSVKESVPLAKIRYDLSVVKSVEMEKLITP